MKKILSLMAGMLCMLSIYAQEIKIEKVSVLENDLSARTNIVLDLNEDPCALIRVQIPTDDEVSFEGNIIQINKTPGEYLVYVPEGTKRIRIKHPQCAPLLIDFQEEGLSIKGKSAYAVYLVLPASVAKPEPIRGFNQVWKDVLVSDKKIETINGKDVTLTVTRFVKIDYDGVEGVKTQGFCTIHSSSTIQWGGVVVAKCTSQWLGSWKYKDGSVLFSRSLKPQYFSLAADIFDEKEAKEVDDFIRKLIKLDSKEIRWEDVQIENSILSFLQDGDYCSMELSSLDEMSEAISLSVQ